MVSKTDEQALLIGRPDGGNRCPYKILEYLKGRSHHLQITPHLAAAANESALLAAPLLRAPHPAAGANGGAHEPAGLGRARGGLRPKLPAPGAALGKPPSFPLTPGQASARAGAETLRPE